MTTGPLRPRPEVDPPTRRRSAARSCWPSRRPSRSAIRRASAAHLRRGRRRPDRRRDGRRDRRAGAQGAPRRLPPHRPVAARILLVEATPRLLAAFPLRWRRRAQRKLDALGVEVRARRPVEHVDAEGVRIAGERIPAQTVIWAAGVQASPAGAWLGAETDRAGRVVVQPDLSVGGHPEVFVVGDTAATKQDGKPLPGIAPWRCRRASTRASVIEARVPASRPSPSATSTRAIWRPSGGATPSAVSGCLQFHGFAAASGPAVHILYLIDFRNRLLVITQWAWAYLTINVARG